MVRAAGAAGDTRRAGLDGSERSRPGPGGEEAEATPRDRSGTAASRGGRRGLPCPGSGFQSRRRGYVMRGRGFAALGVASPRGGGASRRLVLSAAHALNPLSLCL